MTDLEALLTTIDSLKDDEVEQIYKHIAQRRKLNYWLIPGESLRTIRDIMQPAYEQNAMMSETEINAAIDEALTEVRLERQTKTHRRD